MPIVPVAIIGQFCYAKLMPKHANRSRKNTAAQMQSIYVNSFGLLTFDKTVILEVSRMGTINLALRPDVYCIIFQSLEVLSRLKACFFYAMDA